MNGTQSARRCWFRWGSPLDRYVRKSVKEFNSDIKREKRNVVNIYLKQIDVDCENVDYALDSIFKEERPRAKWYWFC